MEYAKRVEDTRNTKVIRIMLEFSGCIFIIIVVITYIYCNIYSNANLIICRIKMCLTPYVSHTVLYMHSINA